MYHVSDRPTRELRERLIFFVLGRVYRTGDGSFDAVWDRASFGAINPEERARYTSLVFVFLGFFSLISYGL